MKIEQQLSELLYRKPKYPLGPTGAIRDYELVDYWSSKARWYQEVLQLATDAHDADNPEQVKLVLRFYMDNA